MIEQNTFDTIIAKILKFNVNYKLGMKKTPRMYGLHNFFSSL